MKRPQNHKIAVIGLGYVGLPLAVEFAANGFEVIGFDINETRVSELRKREDNTGEISVEEFDKASSLTFTAALNEISEANIYIVTVPTPIDNANNPDLTPLRKACSAVAKVLTKDNIVIFESTVYPGCTEEVCVPILERESTLEYNKDFFCGYSPERINPGDKVHRVSDIVKVTSGSTPEIATIVNDLYASIIKAGTHKASSIKVAEAAKVIENAQRDVNIAFVNELAVIFEKLGIDTHEVLAAAGTKWNFLKFTPGLVGGHCIGVDPYYLTHKAESVGYHPEVILAGRRINDNMGAHIAQRVIKMMVKNDIPIKGTTVSVLGITFKENCPDIRNSKVIDVIDELRTFGVEVEVIDPNASDEEVLEVYKLELKKSISDKSKAIVLAVAHKQFKTIDWKEHSSNGRAIFDVKNFLNKELVTERL
ncbi:nucleotide sugar dehydrogenase [Sungkyunkwania multivorans]|uniref:Nucleotide sugar dehydrogenase n=1 Tax=Sungkyunkwania multivorans TaxID=1173618 RepID=A0ABW3D121_9FLAO